MPENIALPIQLNKKEIGRLNTFSFNNKNEANRKFNRRKRYFLKYDACIRFRKTANEREKQRELMLLEYNRRTQMANSESEFIDNCITAIAILCMVGGYFTITVIIPMLIFSNHKNMTLPEQNYTQKILLS